MQKILFLLLLLSQPCLADLYKCTAADKTTYQDKPCQASQIQVVMPQTTYTPAKSQPLETFEENLPENDRANNNFPIERDAHGRIKRSEKAKNAFKAANPCPANGHRSGACPGYVIDHINPLACGGADSPENMQWQTEAEGKAKDGWERDNCAKPRYHRRTAKNSHTLIRQN
jgi:hypothetical protein